MNLSMLSFKWLNFRIADADLERNYRLSKDTTALRLERISLKVGAVVFLAGSALILVTVAMPSKSISLGESTTRFWQAVAAYSIDTFYYQASYSSLFLSYPPPASVPLCMAVSDALAA